MKDYNFFSIYDKRRKQGLDFHSPYVIGLSVVVLFALLIIGLIGRNMLVENHIRALTAEIDTIKASSAYQEAEKLRTNIEIMQLYDQNAQVALEKFEGAKVLGTSFLQQVSGTVPAGVSINRMTVNNTVLQIICTVPTRKAAAEFQLHLKELALFENVHMNSVTLKTGVGFVASIECIIAKAGEAK